VLAGVWLAAWLSLAIQPCCDVFASVLPHGHATAADQPHGDRADSRHGHGHHGNPEPAHHHCGSLAYTSAPELATAATAHDINPEPPLANSLAATVDDFFPSSEAPPGAPAACTTGPSGPPVYLRTARLRL
jgi:hypothetical protein